MTRRTEPPDPSDALLPTDDERPKPTAQVLVAAWVDGFRERRGRNPHPTLIRRIAGQCKVLAKDSGDDVEAWRTAWRACLAAGRAGRVDVGTFLADENPRSLYAKPTPGELLRESVARSRKAIE